MKIVKAGDLRPLTRTEVLQEFGLKSAYIGDKDFADERNLFRDPFQRVAKAEAKARDVVKRLVKRGAIRVEDQAFALRKCRDMLLGY